ncbi:GGDEF domain-containing protein [Acinetobacter nectaris]|uniref:GGDEF domain-containing protein n=1 Tax=Acinetobacter nectaris TaxID=1219382 RepID=UPI00301A70E4
MGRFLGKSETILIAIIDNFKQVNDSFGHLMEDRVIISLADQLINSFLEAGLYRYGGDEFIILNVETEQEYKKQLEEFCNQFLVKSYEEFKMSVTLSIGYTIFFENQLYFESFKQLLLAHALYRSKSLGKYTVSIY